GVENDHHRAGAHDDDAGRGADRAENRTAADAGAPDRRAQVVRVVRGNGSGNDLAVDRNVAAADVQPGPVEGARRDAPVSGGGRIAAGRDPQPGDRPAIQAGTAKDVIDAVLVRHADQPSRGAVRDGAGKERWRRAEVTVEARFRWWDLPVT